MQALKPTQSLTRALYPGRPAIAPVLSLKPMPFLQIFTSLSYQSGKGSMQYVNPPQAMFSP